MTTEQQHVGQGACGSVAPTLPRHSPCAAQARQRYWCPRTSRRPWHAGQVLHGACDMREKQSAAQTAGPQRAPGSKPTPQGTSAFAVPTGPLLVAHIAAPFACRAAGREKAQEAGQGALPAAQRACILPAGRIPQRPWAGHAQCAVQRGAEATQGPHPHTKGRRQARTERSHTGSHRMPGNRRR